MQKQRITPIGYVAGLGIMILLCGLTAPAQQKPATPAPVVAPETGQISELEATKLQLYNTQLAMLNSEAKPIADQKQALIHQIEQEHKGYHWQQARNPDGSFSEGLVKDSTAPLPPTTPAQPKPPTPAATPAGKPADPLPTSVAPPKK